MSLYRQARGRGGAVAAAGVAALAVGFAAGFAVSRATASEPSLAAQVAHVQDETREVLDALELVSVHYPQQDEAQRAGARSAADRAATTLAELDDDLRALDPAAAGDAVAAVERVRTLARSGAPAADVKAAADAAVAAVREAARLR